MAEDVHNLVNRGLISRDSYASFIKKFNPQFGSQPAQAAPAESKSGKKAGAPLDVRPAAARNKPTPQHSRAKQKHSKFAKRAGHNPPKPEFAVAAVRDRYGNIYTTDPSYEAKPTSPLPAYRPPPARTTDASRDSGSDAASARAKPKPKSADTVPLPRSRPPSDAAFAGPPAPSDAAFAGPPSLPARAGFAEPFGGELAGIATGPLTGAPRGLPPTGATPAMAAPPPAAVPQPGQGFGGGYAAPMPSPLAGSYGGGDTTMQPRFPLPQATQDFLARLLGIFNR